MSLFTGPNYELKGAFDDDAMAQATATMKLMIEAELPPLTEDTLSQMRSFMKDFIPTGPEYDFFNDQVDVETITIDGTNYHQDASSALKIQVHKKKGSTSKAALVFFHGGGGVFSSAAEYTPFANRYAVECDATIFSVEYRLAPEHKSPAGPNDAFAALRHVCANARALGVDPAQIAMFGESGGAWITTAVGMMMAERNESHLVKFQLALIPQTGNHYVRGDAPDSFTPYEEPNIGMIQAVGKMLSKDEPEVMKNDRWIWTNLMGDELAKKVPPTIIYTLEFDFYRRMAEESAELYKRNGTLLDYGCLSGVYHGHFMSYGLKKTDVWYKDVARICSKYLIKRVKC